MTRTQYRAAIAALGVSQAQAAAGAGISRPTIERWLTMRGETTPETLAKLKAWAEAQGIRFTSREGRLGITWPAGLKYKPL